MTKPNKQASTVRQKLSIERFTLRQAAITIANHTSESVNTLIARLTRAAEEGTLPVYAPGANARHSYGEGAAVFVRRKTAEGTIRRKIVNPTEFATYDYEEAYWDDLNAWLDASEKRIAFRFPAPAESKPESEAAAPNHVRTISTSTRKRSNLLAAVIETAKSKSQSPADSQSVWAELVKLADSQVRPAPLIGFVESEGVKYQGDKEVKFFTKRNLSDRMRRAKQR